MVSIDIPTSLNISKVSSMTYQIYEQGIDNYPKGTGRITLQYVSEQSYLIFLPEARAEYDKFLAIIHRRVER